MAQQPTDGATGPRNATGAGTALTGPGPRLLVGLYVAVALLPLALAALQGLPPRNLWRELSSGLVIVAFAIMLVQFVLSGRFRRVSGKVGIDLTMRFHQLVTFTILAFVVIHPLLYAAPRLSPNPGDAASSLVRMFSSGGLRTGVVAWFLLILLVPMAVFRDRLPFRYEAWRLSHGLGAAAIAILAADHTLSVGTYSADPPMAWFWLLLTALALLSLAYVYVLKPILKTRSPYRVVSNGKVAERMWEIVVEPERGPAMDFLPGQFVWLNLGHAPFSLTEHPFSISSAPHQRPLIAFTVKENGDFTSQIGAVKVGARAFLDGPHGSFTIAGRKPGAIVLIAGGVGFAPIMGLMRHLSATAFAGPVHLIYGNRAATQILYRDEIEAMRATLDLKVDLVLSEPPEAWTGRTGELTAETLRACLDPAMRADGVYFLCGPPAMMNSVERSLIDLGVAPKQIVSERFKYD